MFLVKHLGTFTYRLLQSTYRYRVEGLDRVLDHALPGRAHVGVCWHQRLFCMPFFLSRLPQHGILISQSKDGRMIAHVVEGIGLRPVFGSSSRRGRGAALEALHILQRGGGVGITPDGPRGPGRRVQPGAVALSVDAGAPVLPFTVSARRTWWAPSWDRFLFPKPFSPVLVLAGPPLFPPPRHAGDDERKAFARRIATALDDLTAEADRRFGWHVRNPRAALGLQKKAPLPPGR